MNLLVRLRALLVPRRTDWNPDAVPTTPRRDIPPDQGDAESKP